MGSENCTRIITNAQILHDKCLQSTVLCSPDRNAANPLTHVTLDSSICLVPDPESNVEVNIESEKQVGSINVVSEAKVIELFGSFEEYLGTCHTTLVDDWEGSCVYLGTFTFPTPVNKLSIRFARTKGIDQLWIYSIQLSLSSKENTTPGLFNIQNVGKLIEKSEKEISDKAEKFMSFLQTISMTASHKLKSDLTGNSERQLSNLTDMTGKLSLSSVFDPSCKLWKEQECLSSPQMKNNNENDCSTPHVLKNKPQSQFTILDDSVKLMEDHLTTYIDKSLCSVENRILKHIDMRFSQIQEIQLNQFNTLLDLIKTQKNENN